jgi:hypothetical protein
MAFIRPGSRMEQTGGLGSVKNDNELGPTRRTTMSASKKRPPPQSEAEKAMADYEAQGRAVRLNMEKLKALRLAKEAAEAASTPPKKAAPRGAKQKSAASGKATLKLSQWLANEEKSGRRT